MKVFIINANWGHGGPGGIAADLYNVLEKYGHECCFAYARKTVPDGINSYKIGSKWDVYVHALIARFFDNAGFLSNNATKKLIKKIKDYNPDIISIQNPLGYSLNVELLMKFIKKEKIPSVWTLHDCWAFTGHCTTELCENLKYGCGKCPHKKEFPKSILFDRSAINLKRKKENFSGISSLQFVAPSEWIAGLARESYLKQYPIKIIPNGIDLDVFKPTQSNLRSQYNIGNKKVILAVASVWSKRKGSKYLYEVVEKIGDLYQFVIIGKNEDTFLRNNTKIIHIPQTTNRIQLAQWYTLADVLLNPTMGDNFPTVNLESLACGTPVVSFDTGGSSESIGNCGEVVEQGNVVALVEALKRCLDRNISLEICVERAQNYDKNQRYKEYIKLYESISSKKEKVI